MEIKDSGTRRICEETGAVRDLGEGKGRFDLMPMQQLGMFTLSTPLAYLVCGKPFIDLAIEDFVRVAYKGDEAAVMLDLAKHYENGALKYGENNWQKGLPTSCYFDSACRHYWKWRAGHIDENHAAAFVWNLVCMKWTIENHPELDDYYGGAEVHWSVEKESESTSEADF